VAGGFALLAAADFNAEEGVADGFNSSVMLWDAGGGGEGDGSGGRGGGGPLRSLHDSLTAGVFKCLMRWDHWVEMVVRFIGRPSPPPCIPPPCIPPQPARPVPQPCTHGRPPLTPPRGPSFFARRRCPRPRLCKVGSQACSSTSRVHARGTAHLPQPRCAPPCMHTHCIASRTCADPWPHTARLLVPQVVCFPRSPKPHEVDADWIRHNW